MPDFSKHREKTSQLVKRVGDKALDIQSSSSQHLTKYVGKRKKNILGIRRFMASWLALVLGLCILTVTSLLQIVMASQTVAPKDGGVYTEGMIGSLNNLNPLFGSGTLDDSASRLLFNGLLRYNTEGELVPDLAQSWSVGEDRKTYTVILKKDITWHDSEPFTADDVVFTIKAIQNAETRSPLFSSWQGITVQKTAEDTVQFVLPAVFAPFPNALTAAILPAHLLKDIPAQQLRSTQFNSQPVGTGPFVFSTLRALPNKEQQLELVRNEQYFRGAPRLDRFAIHTFHSDTAMADSLKKP